MFEPFAFYNCLSIDVNILKLIMLTLSIIDIDCRDYMILIIVIKLVLWQMLTPTVVCTVLPPILSIAYPVGAQITSFFYRSRRTNLISKVFTIQLFSTPFSLCKYSSSCLFVAKCIFPLFLMIWFMIPSTTSFCMVLNGKIS